MDWPYTHASQYFSWEYRTFFFIWVATRRASNKERRSWDPHPFREGLSTLSRIRLSGRIVSGDYPKGFLYNVILPLLQFLRVSPAKPHKHRKDVTSGHLQTQRIEHQADHQANRQSVSDVTTSLTVWSLLSGSIVQESGIQQVVLASVGQPAKIDTDDWLGRWQDLLHPLMDILCAQHVHSRKLPRCLDTAHAWG